MTAESPDVWIHTETRPGRPRNPLGEIGEEAKELRSMTRCFTAASCINPL